MADNLREQGLGRGALVEKAPSWTRQTPRATAVALAVGNAAAAGGLGAVALGSGFR